MSAFSLDPSPPIATRATCAAARRPCLWLLAHITLARGRSAIHLLPAEPATG